jgi:hypothetical protein
METYEYVTSPTGTTHLIPQENRFRGRWVTLCGRRIVVEWDGGWDWGEETQTGFHADCKTCRRMSRAAWQRAAIAWRLS